MQNINILCLILSHLLNLWCHKTKRCVTHDTSEQTIEIEIAPEHVNMLIAHAECDTNTDVEFNHALCSLLLVQRGDHQNSQKYTH